MSLCICVCVSLGVSVFHDVADSLHWTWADSVRLDSLSVEHPSPVSLPSLSSPNYHSLCPCSPPLSLHPYQCPSIRLSFNFSFQVQSFWCPLTPPPTTLLPPFLSSSTGLSVCRPHPFSLSLSSSLSREVNMPLHVAATCQSSYDSQQNVHSCGQCVCVPVWRRFSKCIWECVLNKTYILRYYSLSSQLLFKGKWNVPYQK